MQPREYQFQALRDTLTALTAQNGVELHIGGFFEYADCDSPLLRLLSDYIVHENPYCLYVKTNPSLWRECIYLKRQMLRKLEAVSYTHLDVYKRQSYNSSPGCVRHGSRSFEH